ncbi:MAG: hypothetical protein F6K47_42990 [Symploca sp. SIO2E6]|nr:hypothetical protein [Symploca sp. SIO2E6]
MYTLSLHVALAIWQEAEGRRQEAEGRGQEAEGRRQEAEGRGQEAEGRRQEAEGRGQEAEGRRQEAEGRRQEAEGKGRKLLSIPNSQYPIPNTQFPIPNSQYPIPNTQFPIPQLKKVEVLNASANSWGPRNELAYLKKFGTFEAQLVVLLINTDDLFATAPTSAPVGRDRNYPDRKPFLALTEVFNRYLLPKFLPEAESKVIPAQTEKDPVGRNLEAIGQIQTLSNTHRAEFVLLMTPLLREIGEPGPRDYELQARSRLREFTTDRKITYVDLLPVFKQTGIPETFYRDHIHLSPQGNQKVSEFISSVIIRT